jgi:F-type H+-transporting ATPase subunit epsilon
MTKLHFELTTPERVVLKKEIESATLPTQLGEITVLPGHVPLVGNLMPGMITLRARGEEEYLAVSGGFIEIQPQGHVIVLADTAERAEELDVKKIEEAREAARQVMVKKKSADDVSSATAVAALERELARLKVARKHRSRGMPHP